MQHHAKKKPGFKANENREHKIVLDARRRAMRKGQKERTNSANKQKGIPPNPTQTRDYLKRRVVKR